MNHQHALFAEHAWLPQGWCRNVRLEWDQAGMLTRVQPDAEPDGMAPVAAGPVLPGMPNLHSHAFQRAMAGLTEYRAARTDTFWSWRELMYRFAQRITPENLEVIVRWLYIEMIKAGYTSVCEFHYVHHQADGHPYASSFELGARVVAAAADVGMGLTMLPVLYQYSGLGAQPPRPEQQRFLHTPETLLEMLASLREAYPEHPGLRYGVAPHSLRAVSSHSLRTLLGGLDALLPGAPVHIHIAEQRAEVEACVAGHGLRPVQWLFEQQEVDPRWCLVHATHMDAAETRLLARSGAIAGLCPTTEANLGDGVFPAHDYLAADGRIGIGSDSHIALDWRAELRLLEYGQRLIRCERNILSTDVQPQIGERLFSASVMGGAQASGRPVGALRAGARADWMVLDAAHPALAGLPSGSWLSSLVFCQHGDTPIRDVYIAGVRLVTERRHRDEDQAYTDYRMVMETLLKD
ncbi:formimidoylglutamate deiminase [Frateuria aurantia]